ncbi:endothelial cell-specific molecule 1-like [Arapaima gigas]
MKAALFTAIVALMLRDAESWAPGAKYPVSCPGSCSVALCGAPRCARTVLDDCGCCQVCAAARGEHCYRTVSGMHGVKCGAGLFCEFYKEEDDYGDEYGVCRECPYGKYGAECRQTCSCKAGGICDRVTGRCLRFNFFAKLANQAGKGKGPPQQGSETGSGDSATSLTEDLLKERSSAPNRLNPR